jgi:dUTPase
LDLFVTEDVEVFPGEVKRYDTGLKIALKSTQVGLYWDKSGRTWDVKQDRPVGLSILGGCIDGPYRGPLTIVVANLNLFNTLQMLHGLGTETDKFILAQLSERAQKDVIRIPYGKALTQIIVFDGPMFPSAVEVNEETWQREYSETARGEKGFGSSDVNPTTFLVTAEDGPLKGKQYQWPYGQERQQLDGHEYKLVGLSAVTYAEKPTSKMFACEIVDGPHRGAVLGIVPKDVLYYKGERHERISPDGLNYRHNPMSPSSVATVLRPLSEFGGGVLRDEDGRL